MRTRLSQIEKRHDGKSDEELEALIAEKQAERRAFAREHRGPFPEDTHARFDELIAEAGATLERGLASAAGGAMMLTPTPLAPGRSLSELAAFDRVVHGVKFQERIRLAIDAASPPLAKAKVDEKLARLDDEVGTIADELRRRVISRRRDEADAELAHLGGGDRAA